MCFLSPILKLSNYRNDTDKINAHSQSLYECELKQNQHHIYILNDSFYKDNNMANFENNYVE